MTDISQQPDNGSGEPRPEDSTAARRRLLQCLAAAPLLFAMPRLLLAKADTPAGNIVPFITATALADKLVREINLPESTIRKALNEARFTPSVIQRMEAPYEARPYYEYRPLFVNARLAGMGKEYLSAHRDAFASSERKYGVERQIIAAILGMETHYGRSQGKDSVLNALFTLATGYPRRAKFFRNELGQFLLLCQEEGLKPTQPVGSYAGAFGTTQFIPSSFRHFAVDANGDGKRDVWNSPPDIIASVANYFHKHHWEYGKPVAHWLPPTPALNVQARMGLRDWKTVGELAPHLPKLPDVWHADDKVAVIEMDAKNGQRLALVHYNFYVITRWNRSYNYAMAASELAAMLGCRQCRTGA